MSASFATQMNEHARLANCRLAAAIDSAANAARELEDALTHQREVLKALRVIDPGSYQISRGVTLETRAKVPRT